MIAALGVVVGAGGTLLLVGGLGTVDGLLFVAGAAGLIVGSQLQAPLSVLATLAAILAGDSGAWILGRSEGGVLDLPTYLLDVFGLGLVGQVVVGWVAAAFASFQFRRG